MARANIVRMSGIVDNIRIGVGNSADEMFARIVITTVRRTYMNDVGSYKGEIRADQQVIVCRDTYKIKHYISQIKKGDRIDIKGSLSSRDVSKKLICPKCNTINLYEGSQMIYVDPIHVRIISSGKSFDEEWKVLQGDGEISNEVIIFGSLCNDPIYYRGEKTETSQFLIASDRKRRIEQDGPNKKTDYLPVITYGRNSLEYKDALHVGSEIYIDGAVQTREFEIHRTCENCGCEISSPMRTSEIVPYSIEYVYNCNFPDKEE